MSVLVQPPPKSIVAPIPKLEDILNGKTNYDVEIDSMVVWDKGVFQNELRRQGLVQSSGPDGKLAANTGLQKGTYKGTKMALTELYSLVEEA